MKCNPWVLSLRQSKCKWTLVKMHLFNFSLLSSSCACTIALCNDHNATRATCQPHIAQAHCFSQTLISPLNSSALLPPRWPALGLSTESALYLPLGVWHWNYYRWQLLNFLLLQYFVVCVGGISQRNLHIATLCNSTIPHKLILKARCGIKYRVSSDCPVA